VRVGIRPIRMHRNVWSKAGLFSAIRLTARATGRVHGAEHLQIRVRPIQDFAVWFRRAHGRKPPQRRRPTDNDAAENGHPQRISSSDSTETSGSPVEPLADVFTPAECKISTGKAVRPDNNEKGPGKLRVLKPKHWRWAAAFALEHPKVGRVGKQKIEGTRPLTREHGWSLSTLRSSGRR
jgi:hypothetical protein